MVMGKTKINNKGVTLRTIITTTTLRAYINIPNVRISHNPDTQVARITHNDYEVICDINQWLLDTFPHYVHNITYGLPSGNATWSWLDIICIDK